MKRLFNLVLISLFTFTSAMLISCCHPSTKEHHKHHKSHHEHSKMHHEHGDK